MSSVPPKRRRTREMLTYEKKKNLIREIENSSIDIVAKKYGIKKPTLYGFIENKKRIFDACDKGLGMKKKLPKDDDKCDESKKKKLKGEDEKTRVGENEWSTIRNNYAETDIYLAVEMGLFFKTKINECRQLRDEKCESGDMSDRRFTALICSDLTGNDVRKLVVVGKSQKLSTILPLNYYHDENAWMTSDIFKKELTEWDAELQTENRNIMLFTDEKLVHRRLEHLKRIKLMFYTDMNTQRNIIFDMVRCTKAIYRRNFMEYLAETSENNPSGKIIPAKAVLLLFKAYKAVQPEAFKSSFIEAGIIGGDSANVFLSVIDTWSQSVSPDYTLLKAYTEFDDQLVTSAEGIGDESEEGEPEEESDRLVTVEEAFEAARALGDYCAQGSLSEDLTAKVMDIVVEVEEQLRSFKSLLASERDLGQNAQPGSERPAAPEQVTQGGQCMAKSTTTRPNRDDGSVPSGSGRSRGTPARKDQSVPAQANKPKRSKKQRCPPATQSHSESNKKSQNMPSTEFPSSSAGNDQGISTQQGQRRPSTEGQHSLAGNNQDASTSLTDCQPSNDQQGQNESAQVEQPRPSTSMEVHHDEENSRTRTQQLQRRASVEVQPSPAKQVISTSMEANRPAAIHNSGTPTQQGQRRPSLEVQRSAARQHTVILSTQQTLRRPSLEVLSSLASPDQGIPSQQNQRRSSDNEQAQPVQPNQPRQMQHLPQNQSMMGKRKAIREDYIYRGPNGKVISIDIDKINEEDEETSRISQLRAGGSASRVEPGHPSVSTPNVSLPKPASSLPTTPASSKTGTGWGHPCPRLCATHASLSAEFTSHKRLTHRPRHSDKGSSRDNQHHYHHNPLHRSMKVMGAFKCQCA